MIAGVLGKKLGMTRVFVEEGRSVAVTVLKVGPCSVVKVKNRQRDGYDAVQLGFGSKRESRVNKPVLGHFKAQGLDPMAHLKEFRVDDPEQFRPGQTVGAELFAVGEKVDVRGRSKGRGFQGVIRRWGFAGLPATHGTHKVQRSPGSIGTSATPSKVLKGRKLPGHMGDRNLMVKNLEVVDVRPEENVILVKGAVPGSANSLVTVHKIKKG